jgi:hypothetical protein
VVVALGAVMVVAAVRVDLEQQQDYLSRRELHIRSQMVLVVQLLVIALVAMVLLVCLVLLLLLEVVVAGVAVASQTVVLVVQAAVRLEREQAEL